MAERRFLCVGAAHWDVVARAQGRLDRGGDVPGGVVWRPGGVALNVAVGLARRGRAVGLCAAIGQDFAGAELLRVATAEGVDCDSIIAANEAATGAYVAVEDGSGDLVAAVAAAEILVLHADAIIDRANRALTKAAAGTVMLEANLPADAIETLAHCAREAGWRLALNPVSPAKAARLATALTPGAAATLVANLAEASALTGRAHETAARAASALVEAGAEAALITDGPRSAALATAAGVYEAAPNAVAGASVTGAGDALMAGYLACAERLADPHAALRAALDAAEQHMKRSA